MYILLGVIGYIEGKVIRTSANAIVVLSSGGVGYQVIVNQVLSGKLIVDSDCKLWTYTHVKEDVLELFGFETEGELELFKLLLDVSGVGPRTALAVVGLGVGMVIEAIREGDERFFTSVPRLGNKNAQKIIIELKNRVDGFAVEGKVVNRIAQEVREALVAMGYGYGEIAQMMEGMPSDIKDVSSGVRWALKKK